MCPHRRYMTQIPSSSKIIHGKNNFAEVFKNLTSYRSENNFIGLSK